MGRKGFGEEKIWGGKDLGDPEGERIWGGKDLGDPEGERIWGKGFNWMKTFGVGKDLG